MNEEEKEYLESLLRQGILEYVGEESITIRRPFAVTGPLNLNNKLLIIPIHWAMDCSENPTKFYPIKDKEK